MTRTRTIRAGALAVPLVAAAVSGTAGAVESTGGTPHPHTPVTRTTYTVGVTFEPGDAVVDAGVANVTLAFGVDSAFDGSVANASVENTTVLVAGEAANVSNVTVDRAADTVTVELDGAANTSAGDRMYVKIRNGTTPSVHESTERERLGVDVSVSAPDGDVDGPTRVEYSVIEARADLKTAVVAGFETPPTLHVRGTLPNRGYVVVREATASGPGGVVGVSEHASPSHFPRDVPVALDDPVDDGDRLHLSLYRETTGNDSFDPGADEPYRNAGVAPTGPSRWSCPTRTRPPSGGRCGPGRRSSTRATEHPVRAPPRDRRRRRRRAGSTAHRHGPRRGTRERERPRRRRAVRPREPPRDGVVDLDGDGEGRVSDDAMTVAAQSVSASVDDGTLVVDSERGDYVARVRADGADAATLRAAFGDAVVSGAGDGVPVRVPADGRVAVDTTPLEPGEYALTVTVPDTGAAATATLNVAERGTATARTTAATTEPSADGAATVTGRAGESGETGTTAPLGPLVALAAATWLLLARGRR